MFNTGLYCLAKVYEFNVVIAVPQICPNKGVNFNDEPRSFMETALDISITAKKDAPPLQLPPGKAYARTNKAP